ncbi:MAG: hypothetical protein R3349_01990 [Geminicoccaceae bacterium]|nr:hypothetical protein [Geminicoccaceae bacterium]
MIRLYIASPQHLSTADPDPAKVEPVGATVSVHHEPVYARSGFCCEVQAASAGTFKMLAAPLAERQSEWMMMIEPSAWPDVIACAD